MRHSNCGMHHKCCHNGLSNPAKVCKISHRYVLCVWGFFLITASLSYLNLSCSSCIVPYLNFIEHFKVKHEVVIPLYVIRQNAPTSVTFRQFFSLTKRIDSVYLHSPSYILHLYKNIISEENLTIHERHSEQCFSFIEPCKKKIQSIHKRVP